MQNCVPRASFQKLNKFTGEISEDKILVMFTDLDHLLVIRHNWRAIQLKHNWDMELKECKEISLPGHNTSVVSTFLDNSAQMQIVKTGTNMHRLLCTCISDKLVKPKHSPDCYQVYQGHTKELLHPLLTAHAFLRGDS